MPSFTKIDIVNDAYSQMRISGITVDPTPEDVALAVDRLDDMMAEFNARNVCINYEFEENPNPITKHGVGREHHLMMAANLAMWLLQDFGKDIPPSLYAVASRTYDTTSSVVAVKNLREVQQPSRMPRGTGTRRFNRWRRYFPPNPPVVSVCSNITMFLGDTKDEVEFFVAYLESQQLLRFF